MVSDGSPTTTPPAGGLRPEVPSGRIDLDDPPRLSAPDGAGGILASAVPMVGSLGSVVLVASVGSGNTEVRLMAAGLFLVGTLAFLLLQFDRQRLQRRRRTTAARRGYQRHLAAARAAVREAAVAQRRALVWRHPPPGALVAIAAEGSRVGERGPDDPSFLQVRYGVCAQPAAVRLAVPDLGAEDADPAAVAAARRLLAAHRGVADLPAAVDLRRFDRITVVGAAPEGRALARAIVCAAATLHSPAHLRVAVLGSAETVGSWEWVKWLPHAASTSRHDAVGALRLVATAPSGLTELLDGESAGKVRVLVVVDDGAEPRSVLPARDGLTLLEVAPGSEPVPSSARQLVLEVRPAAAGAEPHGAPVHAVRLTSGRVEATADLCDTATAEAIARRLAATRIRAGPVADDSPSDLPALLGLGSMSAFDPDRSWRRRTASDRLRVPIGVGAAGVDGAVYLDLKESAQGGMGPHGLVVGATGSGKSELLRTLVAGLTMSHSPDDLNLVLVDFKGGATFAGLADLPHVSAVITNLAAELALVDRMQDALAGEMVRRQELLRAAGNLASVRDLDAARVRDPSLPAAPSLLIVVDEFSELLSAKPEFVDLFVAIGRLGRSLGLHLLLASQRLEEGRLRGLDAHLSYRIGLRTFSAQESRTVLGVPEAHTLPPVPGLGYLRPDPATLTRFRAAYVSGSAPAPPDRRAARPGVLPFRAAPVRPPAVAAPRPPSPTRDGATTVDLMAARMRGRGPVAHRIWLPPLDTPDPLDRLLGAGGHEPLRVPIGTVDRPREQRRDPLLVDLRGAAGHVAVVGGPRSGKSTLLRTLLVATTLTARPEVSWYVVDLGGGGFDPLSALPQVAGVATRATPDVVRRILAEVQGIVDRRETYFRDHGIDTVETYRALRRRGDPGDGHGDVFLCVDGWAVLRAEYDDLEPVVQQIAQRGLTFGVHVVLAGARWADFRATLRDQLGTRLELRLGDPIDSEVDRRTAAAVPVDRPGRGVLPGPLHFLAALPRIDGSADPATLNEGLAHLVGTVRSRWRGPAAPRLRLLPDRLSLADLPPAGARDPRLRIGVDERALAPVLLDPAEAPHLIVFGETGSGKTTLLRTYLRELTRTRTPQQAQVVLVDYRRSLLGEVADDRVLHHLSSAEQARPALEELAGYLRTRLPGPGVTSRQLRERSWWRGAEVFVVVDDYDLVATPQGSPVAVLQPLLAQARDVGVHLVLARRSGGAARGLHEPVVQTLRDLAVPGVLLSGSPEEGPLLGSVRPAPAVPGRGRLVTRDGGPELFQVAWTDTS